MRKIFTTFLVFFIALNLYANTQNEPSDEGYKSKEPEILNIIDAIQTLNSQLKILSTQDDANSTKASENIALLNTQKQKLLEVIPAAITKIKIKDGDRQKFYKQKEQLQKSVTRYEKSGNKHAYADSAIALEKILINETFVSAILKVQDGFKSGISAKDVKFAISEALIELSAGSYARIRTLKDGVEVEKFDEKLSELDMLRQTYEEILNYLKDNAELLSSSKLLSGLNLQVAIDYIDEKTEFSLFGVSAGKLAIIIFVLIFFVSLTRILALLTYKLALSLFSKNVHAEDMKDQIVNIIKRPISSLLIAYALNVCASIIYHPAPIPINITNIFIIIYTLLFAWLVLTILNGYGLLLISELTKKTGRKEVVNLILKIIYFIVIVIAILAILSRMGFDISAIIASLGIGGLAVAFAAKDIIANFFASVMLLFDNSFSQGDWIVCGKIEGTIVEIGLRNTSIRSFDNSLIFVPNSKLASEAIVNWSRRRVGRQIKMIVGVTYNSTPEQIVKCINDIQTMLLEHPGISKPENGGSFRSENARYKFRQSIVSIDDLAGYKSNLFVKLDKLNDSSIDILIYCFSKTTVWGEFLDVKQDVILKIMHIIKANNLNFAFPSQSLYVESGDESKMLPEAKKEKDLI
ncbi:MULTISPECIES: mechanosensitive ion channel family protein [unclassified Campylobacter]|uniref:mechanosensitive ion channel family protein n=1 Tax=unclassified Campylobacter TaxID=2593542 RepID=UPI003D34A217